jgi:hypothetical protein
MKRDAYCWFYATTVIYLPPGFALDRTPDRKSVDGGGVREPRVRTPRCPVRYLPNTCWASFSFSVQTDSMTSSFELRM